MAEKPAPAPSKVSRSGPEGLFLEEMAAAGAKVEAYIHRPQQDWAKPTYGYRLTLKDGKVKIGVTMWDVGTFSRILDLVKEG